MNKRLKNFLRLAVCLSMLFVMFCSVKIYAAQDVEITAPVVYYLGDGKEYSNSETIYIKNNTDTRLEIQEIKQVENSNFVTSLCVHYGSDAKYVNAGETNEKYISLASKKQTISSGTYKEEVQVKVSDVWYSGELTLVVPEKEDEYYLASNFGELSFLMSKYVNNIKLVSDIDIGSPDRSTKYYVTKQNYKLDLNGHELKSSSKTYLLGMFYGGENGTIETPTLTLLDSSENHTGKIVSEYSGEENYSIFTDATSWTVQPMSIVLENVTIISKQGCLVNNPKNCDMTLEIRNCTFVGEQLFKGNFDTVTLQNVTIKPSGSGEENPVIITDNETFTAGNVANMDTEEIVYHKMVDNNFVITDLESGDLLNTVSTYNADNDDDHFIKIRNIAVKPNLSVSGSYTYSGEDITANVNGYDSETMYISGNVKKNAGDYEVSVTPQTKWTDKTNSAVTARWKINQKEVSVKPTDATIYVGETPSFEVIYDGLVSGETLELNEEDEIQFCYYMNNPLESREAPALSGEVLNSVGEHYVAICNQTGGSPFVEDANYKINLGVGKLTVKAKSASGGGSVARYTIEVIENENATVSPNGKVRVKSGADQKFEMTANEGYEISDVLVDNESVGAVTEYEFSNVKKAHTIEVITKEKVEPDETNTKDFYDDVNENDWFYETVKEVTEKEIMNGTGDNKFSPNLDTTRGMVVTILYRLEGKPSIGTIAKFADVEKGIWYSEAISWGEENGIVLGFDENTFKPNDTITREQLSAIIYRYAKHKGYDILVDDNFKFNYSDVAEISDYAIEPMTWACAKGLIQGMQNNLLSPKSHATRAQIATVLTRFYNEYMK